MLVAFQWRSTMVRGFQSFGFEQQCYQVQIHIITLPEKPFAAYVFPLVFLVYLCYGVYSVQYMVRNYMCISFFCTRSCDMCFFFDTMGRFAAALAWILLDKSGVSQSASYIEIYWNIVYQVLPACKWGGWDAEALQDVGSLGERKFGVPAADFVSVCILYFNIIRRPFRSLQESLEQRDKGCWVINFSIDFWSEPRRTQPFPRGC